MIAVALFALACALLPAWLFARNLPLYRPAPHHAPGPSPALSVLIPARDEETNIGPALEAALANQEVDFEVVVLDDHSADRTAEIVAEYSARDARVRLVPAPELPAGWCGKVHACHVLSRHARHELLVFVDADVRLAPDALSRFAAFMQERGCALASGVPRQLTGTLMEQMLIPLIHFVLLGFLPFRRMRRTTDPACASAIGQLLVVRRAEYEQAGGHATIRDRIHDGLALARSFRRAGLRTDLFDATDTATCRMYSRGIDVWRGLAKNATEAMATPRLIGPATLILFSGQILPWILVLPALGGKPSASAALGGAAIGASLLVRCAARRRFAQPWLGVWLHPAGVFLLLAIQWQAFVARVRGRPATWKGRAFALR